MKHFIALFSFSGLLAYTLSAQTLKPLVFSWEKQGLSIVLEQISDQSAKNLSSSHPVAEAQPIVVAALKTPCSIVITPKAEDEAPVGFRLEHYKTVKDAVVQHALEMLGIRYRFGAKSGGSFVDCSLFTQNVYRTVGVKLPRSSAEQARVGQTVSRNELQKGDLLFFHTYRRGPSHVAIYIGNSQIIHTSSVARRVVVDNLNNSYYQRRFLFAKRLPLTEQHD